MNAAFVWKLAGKTNTDAIDISFGVKPFDRFETHAFKRFFTLGPPVDHGFESFFFPTLDFSLSVGNCFFCFGCVHQIFTLNMLIIIV